LRVVLDCRVENSAGAKIENDSKMKIVAFIRKLIKKNILRRRFVAAFPLRRIQGMAGEDSTSDFGNK
jgi:hypothetical protein